MILTTMLKAEAKNQIVFRHCKIEADFWLDLSGLQNLISSLLLVTMNSNDVILQAYSLAVKERDNALAALNIALSKIDKLEQEVGQYRMNDRVSAIFEEYLASPRAGNPGHDSETLKIMTKAWTKNSIEHVTAKSEPVKIDTNNSQPAPNSRVVKRCFKCRNQGHTARECRFNFPCERCNQFGHTQSSCAVSLKSECTFCNVKGHNDEICRYKLAKRG